MNEIDWRKEFVNEKCAYCDNEANLDDCGDYMCYSEHLEQKLNTAIEKIEAEIKQSAAINSMASINLLSENMLKV